MSVAEMRNLSLIGDTLKDTIKITSIVVKNEGELIVMFRACIETR